MTERADVAIVGTGHGGAQAAVALRQAGFAGSIALIGEEAELPYERPPLSKDYLAGAKAFERMLLRPERFWNERGIALLQGRRVTALDAPKRILHFSDGGVISYDNLVWAAGGKPRRLTCDGAGLAGVHGIRSRADVDAIRAALPAVRRIVVVGGGYIGLEAAAVLRGLGKDVVVLEAADRLLARVAGEPISRFYETEHRRHGVEVHTGIAVSCIEGQGGRALGVRLSDGRLQPSDLVIVGIGIEPAIEPLRAAGATCSDGIDVDEYCRTSLPQVFAVGDCAAHLSKFAGGARVRIESVQNATDQGMTAARVVAGQPQPYTAVPWFWSNQYDLKLQTVGLSIGHDEIVLRGEPAARSFSVVYLRQGRVAALDCVNAVRDYAQGKRLVETSAAADRARLGDPAVPLRALWPD